MLVAVMLRLPIYQASYIHHFTIPKISYLEGLNRYIPPFYWGETETLQGHMAYPTLQNRIFIQTYVFAMEYA